MSLIKTSISLTKENPLSGGVALEVIETQV